MITCKFEDGNDGNLRHITVSAIILNDKNELLLGKRASWLREGGKYNLIGGFMSRDETVEEAICREVLEESGYTIQLDSLFFINDNPNMAGGDWQNVVFVFVAHVKDKVGEPDKESTEMKWFALDNLPPKEEIAFDHFERIELYKKHLQKPFKIPFFRGKEKTFTQ